MKLGLHARMTVSYLGVTVAAVVLVEILVTLLWPAGRIRVGRPVLLLGVVVATVPVGTVLGLLATQRLARRLRRLSAATARVAAGDLSPRISATGYDDVGQLERHFNQMTERLAVSRAREHELAAENARLDERARLTRELHDAISQDLFSLTMLAGGLQAALPSDSALLPPVAALEGAAGRITREMRALLLEWRPIALDQHDLAGALDDLAMAYGTRLGITVTAVVKPCMLSAPMKDAVLRVAREALSNAVRHAAADTITFSVMPHGDGVDVLVADNGRGFHPDDQAVRHGFGLRLMRERVEELGGKVAVHSSPEYGTRVQVYLPGEREDDAYRHRG